MATPVGDSYTCASGGTIAAGRHVGPAWLRAAPIGQWSPVPGTALSTSGAVYNWGGSVPGEIHSIVYGWGGWAVDYATGRIWLQGGGHSDYGGNEVYRLEMGLDVPVWTRVIDPTPMAQATRFIDGGTVHSHWNSDGTPVASHLYWNAHLIGDVIFRSPFYADFGQTIAGRHAFAPYNETRLHGFNVVTNTWDSPTARALLPNFNPATLGDTGVGYYAVTDGQYYYAMMSDGVEYKLHRFDPVANIWSAVGPVLDPAMRQFDGYPGALYDSLRGEMVVVGENSNTVVRRWSLSAGTIINSPRTGIPYAASWDSSYTGCCYDSRRDLYYTYSGLATTDTVLYVCDPKSGYAMSAMPGVSAPALTTPASGLNSRFKYFPAWDCIVMQPTYADPIHVLRLS